VEGRSQGTEQKRGMKGGVWGAFYRPAAMQGVGT
jgi:hypothetical protein